jgi:hypothetical protein
LDTSRILKELWFQQRTTQNFGIWWTSKIYSKLNPKSVVCNLLDVNSTIHLI